MEDLIGKLKTNINDILNAMDTIFIVIVILIIYFIYFKPLTSIGVQGDTFREWNVVGSYENHKEAAAAFSRLHDKMIKLGRHLQKKYKISLTDEELKNYPPMDTAATSKFPSAYDLAYYYLRDYNPDVIYENDNKFTNDTSYNLSKGEAIYMCMRKKHNPNILETDNLLMFVLLHEVSHTILKTGWGHEEDFWTVFKWLLREAVEADVYNIQDFSRNPENFCGLEITYNPLLDANLFDIK